jgi:hypothetical protein
MKTSKIQIGATVISSKFGTGTITRIITKATGYVEVNYSGNVRKEMAFNLTDENGESIKAKPANKPLTAEQQAKADKRHGQFINKFTMSQLQDNFLDCQIKSGNYNTNLIR